MGNTMMAASRGAAPVAVMKKNGKSIDVTVYRKTGHNAAPFEKFFFELTELSASRY